jgi:hypothetical protein
MFQEMKRDQFLESRISGWISSMKALVNLLPGLTMTVPALQISDSPPAVQSQFL